MTQTTVKVQSSIAKCSMYEDAEQLYLEIEFKTDTTGLPDCELKRDGLAILFTYSKNGEDEPRVSIWTGRGSHEFGSDRIDEWREFAEIATGLKPLREWGTAFRTREPELEETRPAFDNNIVRFPKNPKAPSTPDDDGPGAA